MCRRMVMSLNALPNDEPLPMVQPLPWLFDHPARVRFPVYDEAGKLLRCPTWWYVNLYEVPIIKVLFEPDLAPFVRDRPDGILEYYEDGQWKELIY
jgi:hypothetical protein